AAYLLMNREAFEAIDRMNRMPGILNDSGWTIWGYYVEGLRTFEADGARLIWREIVGPWPYDVTLGGRRTPRSAGLAVGSALMAVIPVIGLAYGLLHPGEGFPGAGILGFAAISYLLLGINYFLFARRLHAAPWFAPLWVVAHLPASFLMLMNVRRGAR